MAGTFQFLDPGTLTDGVASLSLVQTTADPSQNEVPTYRFAIALANSGLRVGGINLRLGANPFIVALRGHIAYSIEPQHRGHGYAARACRLVPPFAKRHGFSLLWVTCDPDNIGSRRTLVSVGAELVEIVDVPPGTRMYEDGARRKFRFRITL